MPQANIMGAGELRLAAVGCAVGALVLVVGFGRANREAAVTPPRQATAPPRGLVDYNAQPADAARLVNTLARQCEGNFWLLPERDQRWLNGLTAGHGEEMIFLRAAALHKADEKARHRITLRHGSRAGRSATSDRPRAAELDRAR